MENFGSLFPGIRRFYSTDLLGGGFVFLNSHFLKDIPYTLSPMFLNIFNRFNSRKVFSISFKRSLPYFSGIFKVLFVNQKGLCFSCKRPINLCVTMSLSCSFYGFKRIGRFFLLHSYCKN